MNLLKKLLLTLAMTTSVGALSQTYPNCASAASDPDGDGWGWENNQSCIVVVNSSSGALTAQNVKEYMVDANATAETAAMFYNLKTLSKTKFIVGQQDAFNSYYQNNSSMSDIKKTTGSDPGLLGSDFIFITDKSNDGTSSNWFYQQELEAIKDMKEAYSKGMINIMAWHLREPYREETFYVSDMSSSEKANAFKSIMPGGANHEWYKKKLDKVASVFNSLKDANGKLIPVIFRPFHEYDGSWFWWGADFCTAEEYKTVFRFTVDYLKNTKGVHNVIYSLGPDNNYDTKEKYLSRYPGDDYVDVLGIDNYWDLRSGAGQAGADLAHKKLKVVSDLAIEKVKIAAMTETGYEITGTNTPVTGWFSNYLYNALTANNLEIAFVMFWGNGGGGGNNYYVPPPSASNAQDFIDFTNKSDAVLHNELPNMYVLPITSSSSSRSSSSSSRSSSLSTVSSSRSSVASSNSSSRSSSVSSSRSSSVSSSRSSSVSSSRSSSSMASSVASAVNNCTYVVSNQWGTGFTAAIRIKNNRTTAINGWSVNWTYSDGSRVTGGWNATITGGNPYNAVNMGYNGTIQPGQTVEFGMQGTKPSNVNAVIPMVTGAACN